MQGFSHKKILIFGIILLFLFGNNSNLLADKISNTNALLDPYIEVDTINDVYYWNENTYYPNITDKPNIDITEISFEEIGQKVYLKISVLGNIESSEYVYYMIWCNSTDVHYFFTYYDNIASGFSINSITGEIDINFEYSINGNTITAILNKIGESDIIELYSYSYILYDVYLNEWWFDFCPNNGIPPPPPPNTVYVDDDFNNSTNGWGYDHFDNIQIGINNVTEGGYVYVNEGIYYENIIVNKSVKIYGKTISQTIVSGQGNGNVFYVSSDNAVISNFTIIDSGSDNAGIFLNCNASCNRIFSNEIKSCHFGIKMIGSYGNYIKYNTIKNTNIGIYLFLARDNNIHYNNFLKNWRDAKFQYSKFPIIKLFSNRWRGNYWNRPRLLPKIIYGRQGLIFYLIPFINIDWFPAKRMIEPQNYHFEVPLNHNVRFINKMFKIPDIVRNYGGLL